MLSLFRLDWLFRHAYLAKIFNKMKFYENNLLESEIVLAKKK